MCRLESRTRSERLRRNAGEKPRRKGRGNLRNRHIRGP